MLDAGGVAPEMGGTGLEEGGAIDDSGIEV
jgi:hypothetical protein